MCGIAGRIALQGEHLGRNLVELMEAQEHRGADSTGFAIYGPVRDQGYVLRGMGFDKKRMDADLANFAHILRDNGSEFLSDPDLVTDESAHYCFRMEISDPKDIAAWVHDADTISENGPSKFEESTALTRKWYSTPFCRFVTRCIVSAVLVALVSSFLSVVLLKE